MAFELLDPAFLRLLGIIAEGYRNIEGKALNLLLILASLEIVFAALWWSFGQDDFMQEFLKKILKIGFFIFLVTQFAFYMPLVLGGFIRIGHVAGGGTGFDQTNLTYFSPDAIIFQGLNTGFSMFTAAIGALFIGGFIIPGVIISIVVYIIAGIIMIFAFVSVGINVALAFIEFYTLAVLSVVLLPFGVFQHTYFIAEKIFSMIVANGVKLMVLTFMLTVATPLLETYIAVPDGIVDPISTLENIVSALDVRRAIRLLILTWIFSKMMNNVPGLAAGLVGGDPAMFQSANDIKAGIGKIAEVGVAVVGGVATGGTATAAVGAAKVAGAGAKISGAGAKAASAASKAGGKAGKALSNPKNLVSNLPSGGGGNDKKKKNGQ